MQMQNGAAEWSCFWYFDMDTRLSLLMLIELIQNQAVKSKWLSEPPHFQTNNMIIIFKHIKTALIAMRSLSPMNDIHASIHVALYSYSCQSIWCFLLIIQKIHFGVNSRVRMCVACIVLVSDKWLLSRSSWLWSVWCNAWNIVVVHM